MILLYQKRNTQISFKQLNSCQTAKNNNNKYIIEKHDWEVFYNEDTL